MGLSVGRTLVSSFLASSTILAGGMSIVPQVLGQSRDPQYLQVQRLIKSHSQGARINAVCLLNEDPIRKYSDSPSVPFVVPVDQYIPLLNSSTSSQTRRTIMNNLAFLWQNAQSSCDGAGGELYYETIPRSGNIRREKVIFNKPPYYSQKEPFLKLTLQAKQQSLSSLTGKL